MICWKYHLLASIGSEVLLYWLRCRSKMSQNKGSNRAAVFFLLFVFCCLVCQNTLLWFSLFFCSGSRWTRSRRCNDICLIRVKCGFTFPPLLWWSEKRLFYIHAVSSLQLCKFDAVWTSKKTARASIKMLFECFLVIEWLLQDKQASCGEH